MDAFFTACEERRNPKLKGKPVIVGADPKSGAGRGVVSTCNYSARKYGIHSALPISQAWQKCPKAVFLPPDFLFYREVSRNVMDILHSHSDKFQQVSIDEAFLDITESVNNYTEAKELATKIKEEIKEKEGITCSIGVSANKLVAKIGSDHKKPDGLTVVEESRKKEFLEPLPIRKMYGVGPKTEGKLRGMGIDTIGDLALFNKEMLISKFGVYGSYLHMTAHGQGNDIVEEGDGRRSISKETTFFKDKDDFTEVYRAVERMSSALAKRLRKEGYGYKTVGIKIRMQNFSTFTRASTLKSTHTDKETVNEEARKLCEEFEGKKIRLIGVRLSNLEEFKGQKLLEEFMV